MRRIICTIVIMFVGGTLLLPEIGSAQDSLQQRMDMPRETAEIQFFVDWAQFRGKDDNVVLEVYLMLPRTQLDFVKPDTLDKFIARGFVQVALAQNDSVRLLDRWPISDSVDDTSQVLDSQNIPDISVFEAEPGEYQLIVQVIDMNTDTRGTYRQQINLASFSDSSMTISDIEFASIVKESNSKTVFTKYSRDVVPNASLTFGVSQPILYSYAEIYNMNYPSSPDSYSVQYSILDLNNKAIKSPAEITRGKVGNSSVDIGGMNVVGLSSGIYYYRIRVTDLATGDVATRSKKFYVYKQGEKMREVASADLGQDYDSMTEAELDETFEALVPILSSKEKKSYKDASKEGKQNLLTEFWEVRDPDQTTDVNELRIEYMRRLETTNERFGGVQTPGYETDRGRVFLVYGEPDEIERNPVSVDVKPYETWYYHSLEGGSQFVFVDKTGFGTYELVHSTVRNEIYDPNWRRFIESSPSGGSFQGF
ncbi:MAG: GWxTD domain-containing protein [Candidatus Marinimicrobia bacterium]|nr:GWxTD domain-containing protein [Candidatus Neomarinimicrobiota bacterium]MCF7880269.1 GWxTD domain-containing protein [Candidatus Neomarinimicrobiota bacterium]